MSNSRTHPRRIIKELKQLEEDSIEDSSMYVITMPSDNNIYNLSAIIKAPDGSLYEGYAFEIAISIPSDYPRSPIGIKFMTPIQHVNVDHQGDICLDIIKKDKWNPANNIRSVLISLVSFLGDPNYNDPINNELFTLYKKDKTPEKTEFTKHVKEHCEKKAIKST
jgi:ubiquitin-protein ligase